MIGTHFGQVVEILAIEEHVHAVAYLLNGKICVTDDWQVVLPCGHTAADCNCHKTTEEHGTR